MNGSQSDKDERMKAAQFVMKLKVPEQLSLNRDFLLELELFTVGLTTILLLQEMKWVYQFQVQCALNNLSSFSNFPLEDDLFAVG